jgi:hypothetical protein
VAIHKRRHNNKKSFAIRRTVQDGQRADKSNVRIYQKIISGGRLQAFSVMSWSPTAVPTPTYTAGTGTCTHMQRGWDQTRGRFAFRHLTIEVLLPVNSVATSTPTLPAKLGFPETFRSNLSFKFVRFGRPSQVVSNCMTATVNFRFGAAAAANPFAI